MRRAKLKGKIVTKFNPWMKVRNRWYMLGAAVMLAGAGSAQAASNIDQVITAVEQYYDDAVLIGIAVLLFLIGRKVVKKTI